MLRRTTLLAAFLALSLSGCVQNSAQRLAPDAVKPIPGRAVIVFSVAAGGDRPHRRVSVQLDRYDLGTQDTSGNCFHFDHVQGAVDPRADGPRRYFAFDAPAGAYVFSPFNGSTLGGPSRAYVAAEGQVTFIGDFTYVGTRSGRAVDAPGMIRPSDREVRFGADLARAQGALHVPMIQARAVAVNPPHPFLCTP